MNKERLLAKKNRASQRINVSGVPTERRFIGWQNERFDVGSI